MCAQCTVHTLNHFPSEKFIIMSAACVCAVLLTLFGTWHVVKKYCRIKTLGIEFSTLQNFLICMRVQMSVGVHNHQRLMTSRDLSIQLGR